MVEGNYTAWRDWLIFRLYNTQRKLKTGAWRTRRPAIWHRNPRHKTGDVILKVVNVSAIPQQLNVNLQGVGRMASEATLDVISGGPGDVSSIAEPNKVAPKTLKVKAAPMFVHESPAHSVSVLRFKGK